MKITPRSILLTILVVMSLSSYIYLCNVKVQEPQKATNILLEDHNAYNDKNNNPNIVMPDFHLIKKGAEFLSKYVIN